MNPDPKESLPREILEELMGEGAEAFRSVLEKLLNLAMEMEKSEFLGANPYERTSQRRDHANGFKDKTVATRVGCLKLKIPQVGLVRDFTLGSNGPIFRTIESPRPSVRPELLHPGAFRKRPLAHTCRWQARFDP